MNITEWLTIFQEADIEDLVEVPNNDLLRMFLDHSIAATHVQFSIEQECLPGFVAFVKDSAKEALGRFMRNVKGLSFKGWIEEDYVKLIVDAAPDVTDFYFYRFETIGPKEPKKQIEHVNSFGACLKHLKNHQIRSLWFVFTHTDLIYLNF